MKHTTTRDLLTAVTYWFFDVEARDDDVCVGGGMARSVGALPAGD